MDMEELSLFAGFTMAHLVGATHGRHALSLEDAAEKSVQAALALSARLDRLEGDKVSTPVPEPAPTPVGETTGAPGETTPPTGDTHAALGETPAPVDETAATPDPALV